MFNRQLPAAFRRVICCCCCCWYYVLNSVSSDPSGGRREAPSKYGGEGKGSDETAPEAQNASENHVRHHDVFARVR